LLQLPTIWKGASDFLLSCFEYSKILLNILMDDHRSSDIRKLKKQLLLPSHLGYKQNLLKKNKEPNCSLVGGKRFQGLVTFMDASTHDKWLLFHECLCIEECPPLHKEIVHLIMCHIAHDQMYISSSLHGECALHRKHALHWNEMPHYW
jgi:hypothetical protein